MEWRVQWSADSSSVKRREEQVVDFKNRTVEIDKAMEICNFYSR